MIAFVRVDERAALRRRLRRSERLRRLEAALLIAPLLLFLLVFFLLPIAGMLLRSVANPELREVMPRTADAIETWDGEGVPDEPVFATFGRASRDLRGQDAGGRCKAPRR
jgi:putative spermidine/putrescine transport system permease protein